MLKLFAFLGKIYWLAAKRFLKEKYTYRASALAFTTLLALVPLLSVGVFIISIFPIFTRFINSMRDYIFNNFMPTSSHVVQDYLESFVQKAHALPALGILFLFITSVMLIVTVSHTLNEIWHAPKRRKTIWAGPLYWLTLICAPLMISFGVLLSSYLFSVAWFVHFAQRFGIELYMLAAVSFLLNTFIFTLLYIIVPNGPVKWRDGLSGGFIAALLFELAKKCFAYYLAHFPNLELIYGVLSTLPIFLIWLYISWMIVLFGALVSHTRHVLVSKS